MASKPKCTEMVWGKAGIVQMKMRQCKFDALPGSEKCGLHDPVRTRARVAKSRKKYDEHWGDRRYAQKAGDACRAAGISEEELDQGIIVDLVAGMKK